MQHGVMPGGLEPHALLVQHTEGSRRETAAVEWEKSGPTPRPYWRVRQFSLRVWWNREKPFHLCSLPFMVRLIGLWLWVTTQTNRNEHLCCNVGNAPTHRALGSSVGGGRTASEKENWKKKSLLYAIRKIKKCICLSIASEKAKSVSAHIHIRKSKNYIACLRIRKSKKFRVRWQNSLLNSPL